MSEPDVFAALADPTRRTVLQEVATRGSATATELAVPPARISEPIDMAMPQQIVRTSGWMKRIVS